MNDDKRDANALIAAGLSAMRVGSGALRTADAVLAARPTNASNARSFMRVFVVRRAKASMTAVEQFWTSLGLARDQFAACDAALSVAWRDHDSVELVAQLQAELRAAGYDGIGVALHENVQPGEEAEASIRLRSTVARMRMCENRLLATIQGLAVAG